jgi:hypothetical protein
VKILEWTPKRHHLFNVLKRDVLKAFVIVLGSTMIILTGVPIFFIIVTLNIVFGFM